tara:strand:- start:229 stop:417 length:189 start_codon:yes stop_codon:yes gene_type:complete
MSIDTEVSYLLNQLDDLKKRVYKMQKDEKMSKRLAGYGLGIGLTGLAITAYLLVRHVRDGGG